MKALFDNANDAGITTDTTGRVTFWNKTSEKLFGWSGIKKEDAIGKKCHEITHKMPEPWYNRGKLCPLIRVKNIKKDGNQFWCFRETTFTLSLPIKAPGVISQ